MKAFPVFQEASAGIVMCTAFKINALTALPFIPVSLLNKVFNKIEIITLL